MSNRPDTDKMFDLRINQLLVEISGAMAQAPMLAQTPQQSIDDNDDDDADGNDNDAGAGEAKDGGSGPTQGYPASIVMRNTQIQAGTWLQWIMVQWQGYSAAEATWETDFAFYQQHYPDMLATYNNGRVPERVVGAKLRYHPITGRVHYKVQWDRSSFTTMERDIVEGEPVFTSLLTDFRKRQQRGTRAAPDRRRKPGTAATQPRL
jgi:hypothetical protein